jgi:hypothetical protein
MKTRTFLIAAVMLVALSAAAFGQAVFEVSSIPVTAVIKTGNAELPGIIKFQPYVAGSLNTVAGTVQIVYGGTPNLNITSPWGAIFICTDAIRDGAGTVGSANASCTDTRFPNTIASLKVDIVQSVYSPGQLVIDVPAGLVNATPAPAMFMVSGVRLQINGTGISGSQTATISTYGNQIIAGEDHPTVINSVLDGIASVATYTSGVGVAIASATAGAEAAAPLTGVLTPNASPGGETIYIKEGFGAAFTQGVGVRITLSAAPPKGITFTFPTTSQTSYDTNGVVVNPNWVLGSSASTSVAGYSTITNSSTTAASLQVYYYVASDTSADAVNQEYLEIPVTITSNTGTETLPLSAFTITYSVTLAPLQGPYVVLATATQTPWLSSQTTLPTGMLAPRFADLEVPASGATLLTLSPSNASTVLLMPYVSTQTGWDTGVAIANTTEDPGTALLGFTGAVPQAGPITFYFFSQVNTVAMFSYTTGTTTTKCPSGDPGTGLITSTGNVQSGGTYVALLSNLVNCAGGTNPFNGYVIAVTGFTNAHGIFTVSNFTTVAAYSSLMEVLYNRTPVEGVVF